MDKILRAALTIPNLYLLQSYFDVNDSIAHTAEHAFIGSLQRALGQTLSVRKVSHRGSSNTAVIVTPILELQTVLDAQAEVNTLIQQGRKVTERMFASLEDARSTIPGLRANEERISGQVRVVEIEGHDAAACAMQHAQNLRECDFFLITRLSKNGSEYEVDFVVGKQAKDVSQSLTAKLLKVCAELGANVNTIENTVKKLKTELETSRVRLRSISTEELSGISPQTVGRFMLFKGRFSYLDDDSIVEFAGTKIAGKSVAVIIANEGMDGARIVLARSENEPGPDLAALFKKLAGADGRGGGRPHFVTGVVKKEATSGIMDAVSNELERTS